MAYKLVIFDFDGTLADSAGWLFGVLNQVADRYGFRRVGEAEIAMLRGRDNREIVRYLGVPAWKLPLIAAHMRRVARDAAAIPLFEGTPRLLRTLEERGVATAVVSSNSEANVRRILGPECAPLIGCYECGASLLADRPTAEWLERLSAADIPAAPVNDVRALLDDPHLRAVGFWREVPMPDGTTLRTTAPVGRWSATPSGPLRPPPELGSGGARRGDPAAPAWTAHPSR